MVGCFPVSQEIPGDVEKGLESRGWLLLVEDISEWNT